MRADMIHKITIKSLSSTQDSYGDSANVWTNFATDIWSSKEQLLGNEYYTAESTKSKVEVKFRTHFINGVQNEMRVHNGNEVYDILSAINVKSLNRELLMYCKKVDNSE
jgi:SPP1 family predicted phage head-tail adaptor